MRPSSLRHPLAILRQITNLSQKQLADLAQCSSSTIQAIELQKLPMSRRLALFISYQTGVDPDWLLANDVSQPPICGNGNRFTKESFEEEQASFKRSVVGAGGLEAIRLELITAIERLSATASSAHKADRIWLWTYKVEVALEQLEKQFGTDRLINQVGASCYPQMKKRRPVVQPIVDEFGDQLIATARRKGTVAEKGVRNLNKVSKGPAHGIKPRV